MKKPLAASNPALVADRRQLARGAGAAALFSLLSGRGFARAVDPRMTVFRDRKFGMFIHWGPYAQASVEGNFLLNIGPRPDGTIQPEFRERLAAIGRWMAVNGQAVYGTLYGPIQGQAAYRTTAKDGDVFVHIFDWPNGRLSLPNWGRKVAAVRLLSDKRPITFTQNDKAIEIDLAGVMPDPDVTVLKIFAA